MTLRRLPWALATLAVANLAALSMPAVCPPAAVAAEPSAEASPCNCPHQAHQPRGEIHCGCGCADSPDEIPEAAYPPSLALLAATPQPEAPAAVTAAWLELAPRSLTPFEGVMARSAPPVAARAAPTRHGPIYLSTRTLLL